MLKKIRFLQILAAVVVCISFDAGSARAQTIEAIATEIQRYQAYVQQGGQLTPEQQQQYQQLQQLYQQKQATTTYVYDASKMEGPFAGANMPERLFKNIPERKF